LDEALSSSFRTPKNLERDAYRNPQQTLTFFGVEPTMTVVEITPGGGWYTEILAPYLTEKGRYIAAVVPPTSGEYAKKVYENFQKWQAANPELKITTADFAPSKLADIVPPGTADRVLTFRNVHNWISSGSQEAAFVAFYRALKPGGILGVVEHREDPKKPIDPKAASGYMHESEVIRLAVKAGFKLDAKSDINANPKDTKNHPKGVWTLPPSYALGDQDRAKYQAIGESDRMTLRFIKPKS
jgi:predicted methyltransferase